jgi:hypothetical protein
MAITSVTELARNYEEENPGTFSCIRRFVCTLSNDTLQGNPTDSTSAIATACGLTQWGAGHPSAPLARFKKISINERYGDSPYHIEVVAEYGPLSDNDLLSPLQRAGEWTMETSQGELPALFYYSGAGNDTKFPLTNSAYDFFTGLTTDEALAKATLKFNYDSFPAAQANSMNSVNNSDWWGYGNTHCWKVAGVSATFTKELWRGVEYNYWAATFSLLFRQTSWILQLPDVGWNFLNGTEKRRGMVYDFQNGEWVASANPIALNGSGQQSFGQPAILQRRVNPEANFTVLFGIPPS